MKAPKLGLAAALAAALVLSACASGTDSDDDDGDGGGGGASADMKLCMYTHGDGGGFWSVAKKGAEKAADDLGVDLDYQESDNDPEAQAQLIEAGVSGGCDGIAVSAPNPDAIQSAMDAANEAGIPLVTMNSGSADFQNLHAFTHVGQDEFIAGQEAGKRFAELGATKVLCPIQEASNIGLQQRCDGAADTFDNVENLQLSAGLDDLTTERGRDPGEARGGPDDRRGLRAQRRHRDRLCHACPGLGRSRHHHRHGRPVRRRGPGDR